MSDATEAIVAPAEAMARGWDQQAHAADRERIRAVMVGDNFAAIIAALTADAARLRAELLRVQAKIIRARRQAEGL